MPPPPPPLDRGAESSKQEVPPLLDRGAEQRAVGPHASDAADTVCIYVICVSILYCKYVSDIAIMSGMFALCLAHFSDHKPIALCHGDLKQRQFCAAVGVPQHVGCGEGFVGEGKSRLIEYAPFQDDPAKVAYLVSRRESERHTHTHTHTNRSICTFTHR